MDPDIVAWGHVPDPLEEYLWAAATSHAAWVRFDRARTRGIHA